MALNLTELLPQGEVLDDEALLELFLDFVESHKLTLYPAQEQAILELYTGRNVILNTPTGSGKSLVATGLHFQSLAKGRRSVYTSPIKALVNEKWMALCRDFGADNVGLCTGDATVNRHAPILCCTAEVLANIALREGSAAEVDDVVLDEFHWYADRDRGVAWQIPLLTLPQTRFLLMSATLGDTGYFEQELEELTGHTCVTVKSEERPVPLEFAYSLSPLAHTLEDLVTGGRVPAYVVHFTQREAAENAQAFTSINVCSRAEKAALAAELAGFRFTSPYGKDIRRWLRHGIGLHHAGLLPKYRVLVEQLAQKGLLKIICGTDTLGVGINVPIRTVLFTRLCKYDGEKTAILSARDFHQISGRAGRKGFDEQGWVVAQAPEHIIENLKLEKKVVQGRKKATKKRAPDRNYVHWNGKTFQRLVAAAPERLTSQFQVSHGMLLNVLSRADNGCRAMRDLIRACNETPVRKKMHRRRAWQLFRSLVERGIIEILDPTASPDGRKIRVNMELQDDFSMDQALSLYLLETIPLVDPTQEDYALVVLTLAESILENPEIILRKQLDRIKGRAIAEMKMQGMDYEDRMDALEDLEYPKPYREFIYTTFNEFADRHPWVEQENIRPKSIAREMFETFSSFTDYVRSYGLERSEGLLLRHLHSVYKVLLQTVPDNAKDETLREIELYLSETIRLADSSLLDEWEKMRNPAFVAAETAGEFLPDALLLPPDITQNVTAFTAAIRTRIFAFLRAVADGDCELALDALDLAGGSDRGPTSGAVAVKVADTGADEWPPERLATIMPAYLEEHERLCFDPEARNIRHTYVRPAEDGQSWNVQQMLVDPEAHNDWVAEFEVHLPQCRERGEPVLHLVRMGPLG
ncbi:MAG: superfamily II RNA helicase [Planctomycetota bacterium]|jgi:superfamily II RNA helicase